MDERANRKIESAQIELLCNEPFFGSLCGTLPMIENNDMHTSVTQHGKRVSVPVPARTNGKCIQYNSDYINAHTVPEVCAVIAHEVLHVALGHAWRRQGRKPMQWNYAGDYAINWSLKEASDKPGSCLRIPPQDGWLIDAQYAGMFEEQIYPLLEGDEGDSDGNGDEGEPSDEPGEGYGPCEVVDAPDSEKELLEAQWDSKVESAARYAEGQGKLPGSLRGLIANATEARVDWRALTMRWVQQTARADYTYRAPNPRYIQSGLYLPSLRSNQLPPGVLAIDTSGSINDALVAEFIANGQSLMDSCKPERLYVIYCADSISHVDVFEQGDRITQSDAQSGGTAFEPVFAYIAEHAIEPAFLIYLTDLQGSFPAQAPEYPVLWGSTERDGKAPFGEVIYIKE